MALIKCNECGHEVSDKASACPKCGCPIQNMDNPSENKISVKPQPPAKSKARTYVLFAIILSLLIGGGYYAYNSFFKDGDIVELTPEFIEAIQKYDEVESFSEGLAKVKKGEKVGFINTKGEEVVPCKYDQVGLFSDGFAMVKKSEKHGFINIKGEEVVPCKYDQVGLFSDGFAEVKKERKWGFINSKGEEIVPCKYDYAYSFSEGFAEVVDKDGKCGFINTKGEEIIPCKYDEADSFSEGFAMIVKDGKYGFINTKGEEVIPCKYANAASFSDGLARIEKDEKHGFINIKGEEVIPCKYDYAYSFSEGFAAVNKDGKYGFINVKGEEVVPCQYDPCYADFGQYYFSEGLAIVVKENKYGEFGYKYGFVNTKGEEIVPCKYDKVESFSKNGVALATLYCGERAIYGFIDKLGNTTFSKSDYDRHLAYEKQQEEEARKAEEERIRQEEEARRTKMITIYLKGYVGDYEMQSWEGNYGARYYPAYGTLRTNLITVPDGKVWILDDYTYNAPGFFSPRICSKAELNKDDYDKNKGGALSDMKGERYFGGQTFCILCFPAKGVKEYTPYSLEVNFIEHNEGLY